MPPVNDGSSTFDSPTYPLDVDPYPVGVFRIYPDGSIVPHPFLRCISIDYYEGPRPPEAAFRYAIDETLGESQATDFEALLPLGAGGAGAVQQDDRLAVAIQLSTGEIRWLFDGFAVVPEVKLDHDSQSVPIKAVSVAARAWDEPLSGAWVRSAPWLDDPAETVPTGLPARMNPKGLGNCTGGGLDYEFGVPPVAEAKAPVFVDPKYPVSFTPPLLPPRTDWTVDRAARYILFSGNRPANWVGMPTQAEMEPYLKAIVPTGSAPLNINDPSTYDLVEVVVPDQIVSDKPWPEALWSCLRRHGFGFRFFTRNKSAGGLTGPETRIAFHQISGPLPQAERDLYLQPYGQALDPALSNVTSARVERDGFGLVNTWDVRMAQTEVEAMFVLFPGFLPIEDDLDPLERPKFTKTKESPDADPRKYRSWVYCETGEGFWDGTDFVFGPEKVVSFDRIFTPGTYAYRRRPGRMELITQDESGTPRQARLGILLDSEYGGPGVYRSADYPPDEGEVWGEAQAGTIYWIKGGWKLDPDRLGIIVEANDPDAWNINDHRTVEGLNGGVLRLMSWLNGAPGVEQRNVLFVLATVVEHDVTPTARAPKLPSSPSLYTVRRVVDAKDRLQQQFVHRSSPYWEMWSDAEVKGAGGKPLGFAVARDDARKAIEDAEARRGASSWVRYTGTVEIPRLTNLYEPGCRIRRIVGRNLDLRINAGDATNSPMYPRVVQLTWMMDSEQKTVLRLSDPADGEDEP